LPFLELIVADFWELYNPEERSGRLKAWGLKILRKKRMKKAALAVGRKLSVIMHRMLIEQKDFIYGEPKVA
jgi:hypothetical protein